MPPRMQFSARGSPRYPNHKPFVEAVGGVLPGYAGHLPGAINTSGESTYVGVPQTLEPGLAPGQGTLNTLQHRGTTAWQEIGEPYKPAAMADLTDQFKGRVGGVKVGYGGHVPGAQAHYGSMHQGGVPLHDYAYTPSQPSPPHTPTAAELRRHTFVNARELAQSDGTRRQYTSVDNASRSAPFGVDEHVYYATESSRMGARSQVGASDGSRPGTPPREPRAFEATAVYDRDVHHGSAVRDMEKFEVLKHASVPTPAYKSVTGQPLAPFTFGQGQLDPPISSHERWAPRASEPVEYPHTYELPTTPSPHERYKPASYEQAWAAGVQPSYSSPPSSYSSSRPAGVPQGMSEQQARSGSRPSMYEARQSYGSSGSDSGYGSPATPPAEGKYRSRFGDTTPPGSRREFEQLRDERSYEFRTPPDSMRPSYDKTAPSEKVEDFRRAVGGVIPGYKGFIPQTPANVGKSDFGTHDVAGYQQMQHMRGHGYQGYSDLGAGISRRSSRAA